MKRWGFKLRDYPPLNIIFFGTKKPHSILGPQCFITCVRQSWFFILSVLSFYLFLILLFVQINQITKFPKIPIPLSLFPSSPKNYRVGKKPSYDLCPSASLWDNTAHVGWQSFLSGSCRFSIGLTYPLGRALSLSFWTSCFGGGGLFKELPYLYLRIGYFLLSHAA